MANDLDALYQEIILEHNRRPKNFGELPGADAQVAGRNPLCGDEITLWIDFDGEQIADVRFVGSGCAVSKASASMMTQAIKGKTRAEAAAMFDRVHELVVGKLPEEERKQLGQLAALSGVSKFPIRVKCASLAWHALKQALAGEGGSQVSTE
ncbi:MAG TPA: SUF system NifU family Fe-S cluster assembly protein [Gemmatimonadaceae bacterium]